MKRLMSLVMVLVVAMFVTTVCAMAASQDKKGPVGKVVSAAVDTTKKVGTATGDAVGAVSDTAGKAAKDTVGATGDAVEAVTDTAVTATEGVAKATDDTVKAITDSDNESDE